MQENIENPPAVLNKEKWKDLWQATKTCFVSYWLQYSLENKDSFEKIETDEQNILRALQEATEDKFVRGVCALLPYLVDIKGRFSLAHRFINRALPLAELSSDSGDKIVLLMYLGRVEEKLGNYQAAEKHICEAIQHARYNRQYVYLSTLFDDLGFVAKSQGHYQEAINCFQEGIDIAIREDAVDKLVHLLGRLSGTHVSQGNWQLAEEALEKALSKKGQVDESEMIPIYNNLGIIRQHVGDYKEATTLYSKGLNLAESAGNREYMCMLLVNLGFMAAERGLRRQAKEHYHRALKIAQKLGHKSAICVLLCNLGNVEIDPDQAYVYFEEGMNLSRELNHPEYLIASLDGLGMNLALRGEYERARVYMQEGLNLAVSIEHRQTCRLYYLLGDIEWHTGGYAQAKVAFEHALSFAYEVDDLPFVTRTLIALSALETEFENLSEALIYLEKSEKIGTTLENQALWFLYQHQCGELQLALTNYEKALGHFNNALEIGRQLKNFDKVGLTLYGLARCSYALGQQQEARRFAQESHLLLDRFQNRSAEIVADWLAAKFEG